MNTDKILAEAIAKDYIPKENSKIVALKKLDKKAKLPATVFTYTFGIIASLIAGTGMCFAMQVIGSGIAGVVLGIVGFDDIFQKLYENIFNPILERFGYPENVRKYVMMFYLNGITAVATKWLKDGCEKSVEEVSEIVEKCIFGMDNGLSH